MQHRPYTLNQANIALVLLLLAYILSFIDRNIMSVLIGPIRQDFNISDFQYSLLHGFAFSMFYITLGLPIARLADKYPRFNIISIGILLWSFMTCVCGFTKNFFSLFLQEWELALARQHCHQQLFQFCLIFILKKNCLRL